jgi:protein-tyrosine phosphatase
MAEAVFGHKVKQARLEHAISTDSAATGHWHIGEQPHHGTRRVLAKAGIAYSHCARLLVASDLERFDYVLTMDEDNLREVRRMGQGRATVAPLLTYAPETGLTEVPDPYYTGDFEQTYELVEAASTGLLAAIRRDHDLD